MATNPLVHALDLLVLPLRVGRAMTQLPVQLRTTVVELERVRVELMAARGAAERLEDLARGLVARSDTAIARMDDLLDVAPDLLEQGRTATADLQAGLEELQRARAALADVAAEVPAIAEAAEGMARVERTLGLVD